MSNLPKATKEDLQAIGQALPRGSYVKIAKRCKCSDEYVRRFFRGDYNLNDDNIKILDEAESIVKAKLRRENVAQKKMNQLLSQTKE